MSRVHSTEIPQWIPGFSLNLSTEKTDWILGQKGIFQAPDDRMRFSGLEGSAPNCRQACSWAGHRTALSTMIKCWDLEKAFPTSFLIFVPTEVTPQSGTIKPSDICVQRKWPGLETLFSPSLLRVQKLKSEFSPVWHQTQGRGSERKHLWERVCSWESKRERERDWVTWLMLKNENTEMSECGRCKNFWELS